jgi:hypothetical protein
LLLLSAAVIGLWARSYFPEPLPARYADRVLYSHGYVATYRGALTIVYFDDQHGPNAPFNYRNTRWHGFSLNRWRGGSGWNSDWQYTSVDVPIVALAALTSLLAIVGLLFLLSHRFRQGHRPLCGYDVIPCPKREPLIATEPASADSELPRRQGDAASVRSFIAAAAERSSRWPAPTPWKPGAWCIYLSILEPRHSVASCPKFGQTSRYLLRPWPNPLRDRWVRDEKFERQSRHAAPAALTPPPSPSTAS